MENETKKLIDIQFEGFYHSIHDQIIDSGIENHLQDSSGDINPTISDKFYSISLDYKGMQKAYCEAYLDSLSSELGIELGYESMTSPKEYNFSTDRLFCYISTADIEAIWQDTDMTSFAKYLTENFTSYDGFFSFYSPCLDVWKDKPLLNWDHNELGTLFRHYLHSKIDIGSFNCYAVDSAYELVSDFIYADKEASRLVDLARYLDERDNRKQS